MNKEFYITQRIMNDQQLEDRVSKIPEWIKKNFSLSEELIGLCQGFLQHSESGPLLVTVKNTTFQ